MRVGATLQVDLTLRVGAIEENVTVTAEAPQVDLTSAQVGGNVSAGEIDESAVGLAQLHRPRGAAARRGLQRGGRLLVRQRHHQRPARQRRGVPDGRRQQQRRPARRQLGRAGAAAARSDSGVPGRHQPVRRRVRRRHRRRRQRGDQAGHQRVARQRDRLLHRLVDDRRRTSSSRSRTWTSPTRARPSGAARSAGRSSATRCTSSAASSARTENEGRSRVYPTRPDRSFTVAQETNSWNYMGRVDHQLNSSHNYSVRFLWDHQPNYNQVLRRRVGLGGTIDTLSIEKDNDWALVGTYNRVIGGNEAEHPARCRRCTRNRSAASRSIRKPATGRRRRRRCSSSTSSIRRTTTTPTTAT